MARDADDSILTFRPRIEWVEPEDQYIEDTSYVPLEDFSTTVDRTKALKEGFDRVVQLANLVQKRVDDRVNDLGGLAVSLDDNIDANTISAIKRRFPDKDPTKITYDMYKQALNCINHHRIPNPKPSLEDIQAAKTKPTKTDFGGLNNLPGMNRPEVSSLANVIAPVDMKNFQKKGVASLFKLMEPLVSNNSAAAVKQHELTKKHS